MLAVDVFHRYGEPSHYSALEQYDVSMHKCDPIYCLAMYLKGKWTLGQLGNFLIDCARSFVATASAYKPVRIYAFAPDSLYLIPWLLLWWRPGNRYFHTSFSEGRETLSAVQRIALRANLFVIRRYMKGVACVNLASLRLFEDHIPAYLVEHGVPNGSIRRDKTQSGRAIYLGRMVEYKNIAHIAKVCREERLPIDFVGPPTELSKCVESIYCDDQVVFVGSRPREWIFENLARYKALFLLSEAREPFGMSIIEAITAGCIPIVTKTAGTETIFRTWPDYPFFVDLNKSGSVNEAIRALKDPSILLSARPRLDELAERYNSSRVCEKWDNLFHHSG